MKISKSCWCVKVMAVALLAGVGSTISGATLQLNTNPFSNGNGLGGGEFTAVPVSGALDKSAYHSLALYQGNIEVFCLEYNEHFSPGGVYDYTVNSNAFGGDVAGGGGDPISLGTAWLYQQFATGALSTFAYDQSNVAARKNSSSALQLAFWYLEDETQFISGYGSYDPTTNVFLNQTASQFGGLLNAKANANGAFGTAVLNITSGNGANLHQSQTYLTNVPDSATTLALVGMALAGLVAIRRKVA
jgi:hypothetical protein